MKRQTLVPIRINLKQLARIRTRKQRKHKKRQSRLLPGFTSSLPPSYSSKEQKLQRTEKYVIRIQKSPRPNVLNARLPPIRKNTNKPRKKSGTVSFGPLKSVIKYDSRMPLSPIKKQKQIIPIQTDKQVYVKQGALPPLPVSKERFKPFSNLPKNTFWNHKSYEKYFDLWQKPKASANEISKELGGDFSIYDGFKDMQNMFDFVQGKKVKMHKLSKRKKSFAFKALTSISSFKKYVRFNMKRKTMEKKLNRKLSPRDPYSEHNIMNDIIEKAPSLQSQRSEILFGNEKERNAFVNEHNNFYETIHDGKISISANVEKRKTEIKKAAVEKAKKEQEITNELHKYEGLIRENVKYRSLAYRDRSKSVHNLKMQRNKDKMRRRKRAQSMSAIDYTAPRRRSSSVDIMDIWKQKLFKSRAEENKKILDEIQICEAKQDSSEESAKYENEIVENTRTEEEQRKFDERFARFEEYEKEQEPIADMTDYSGESANENKFELKTIIDEDSESENMSIENEVIGKKEQAKSELILGDDVQKNDNLENLTCNNYPVNLMSKAERRRNRKRLRLDLKRLRHNFNDYDTKDLMIGSNRGFTGLSTTRQNHEIIRILTESKFLRKKGAKATAEPQEEIPCGEIKEFKVWVHGEKNWLNFMDF